jgi:uncharacterized membrane protein YsdA (DUF1294 family)
MFSSELPENGLHIPARPAGGVFGRLFGYSFFRKKVTKEKN